MRIVRQIARGGFGSVEEVETRDGTRLARKIFSPPENSPTDPLLLLKRFQREVRIQSTISHPNVMPVVKSNMEASPPWFTMPLATMSLEERFQQDHATGRPFDISPWPDILGAVEELHRLGFVHRDLKPANILFVEGTWVISDFGLILPMTRDTTILSRTGTAFGSVAFLAPEQLADFSHTPQQADIYALGCILHEAVADRPQRIPFSQIRDAGQFGPLLEKCTDPDYSRRFPTVSLLRAALFDLRPTADLTATGEVDFLEAVVAAPGSPDPWRRFLQRVESLPTVSAERYSLLRGINSELLIMLRSFDEVLFSRLVTAICEWVKGTAFDFSYCDVVGDRLLEAYRVSSTRLRSEIVLAALELSVSHNRWHVMQQVGAMLGNAADNGLVDRMLIEMQLDDGIEARLRTIESVIHWPRSHWHERIGARLQAGADLRRL